MIPVLDTPKPSQNIAPGTTPLNLPHQPSYWPRRTPKVSEQAGGESSMNSQTDSSGGTPGDRWRPKANPWLIAIVVAMAAFMEVLDTSIANVALPHIAGNLSSSNDESTWILASYLASNAIVLPMTGWFAGLFGRKRFFMICLVVFTLSSLLCGMVTR